MTLTRESEACYRHIFIALIMLRYDCRAPGHRQRFWLNYFDLRYSTETTRDQFFPRALFSILYLSAYLSMI